MHLQPHHEGSTVETVTN